MACEFLYSDKWYTEDQLRGIYDQIIEGSLPATEDVMLSSGDSQTVSTKASAKSIGIVKNFLDRIGVPIEEFNGRINVEGETYTVGGVADYFQGLVHIAYGEEATALPEEAMHFAVELLKKKSAPLYKKMFNNIGNYKMFYEVANEYKNVSFYQRPDGLPDIPRLKDEAIAKLLAEVLIRKNDGYNDRPELLVEVKSWWQEFLDWLKALIGWAQIDPFEETIEKYVEGTEDIGDASVLREEGGMNFQLSGNIYSNLKTQDINVAKTEEGYIVNGEAVRNTVDSKIEDLAGRRAKPLSEAAQFYKDFNDQTEAKVKTDIKDILDRHIDENGDLRPNPLPNTNPSAIDPYNETFYATLNANIEERLSFYPAGTKFMKSINVYDGISTAGTIDLLAIMPDDRIDILQFKVPNIPFGAKDIPAFVQNLYNSEIEEFRRILQTGYGVKRAQFKQTRVLPVRGYYARKEPADPSSELKLNKLTVGGVDVKLIEDDSLIPVPGESESTGDEQFDKFISRLRGLAQKLAEERVPADKRVEKNNRVNQLITAIRKLQIQGKADNIISSAKLIVAKQKDTYAKLQEAMKSTDPDKATIEQLDNMATDMMDQKDIIELYSDLYDVFRDVFGDESEESKVYLDESRKVSDDARDILNKYWKMIIDFRKEKWAAKVGIKDEFVPEKQLTWYRRMIRSLSQSSIKAGELLWDLVKKINNRYVLEFQDRLNRLHGIQEEVEKWLNGKSVDDLYKHIFQIDKEGRWNGAFVQKYSKDFYKGVREAQEKMNFPWVLENIDIEAYNRWYTQELANREDQAATSRVHEDDTQNARILQSNIDSFKAIFSLETMRGVNKNNFMLKNFPKEELWKSEEYKELEKPENAAVKQLYDYWVEKLKESLESGMIEEHNGWSWFPNVRKNLLEKWTLSASKGRLFSPFSRLRIEAEDTSFGKIDPLTGKPIDKIHAAFVSDLGEWVKGANEKYFLDYSQKSMDVFKVLALWEREIVRYKLKTESEGLARLLHYTEENRDAYRTTRLGALYRDVNQRPSRVSNEVNARYIKEHIDAVYYGKILSNESDVVIEIPYRKTAEKINKLFGREVVQVPREETISLSGVKLLDSINRFYTTKTLGLNIFTSLSNLFGGTVNSYINQGKMINKADLLSAEMQLVSGTFYKTEKDKKVAGLLRYFRPYGDDEFNQEIRKMSLSNWIKYLASDYLFFMQRNSDRMVNGSIAIAYFHNTMVRDGKLVNIREFARKELGHNAKYAGTYEQSKEFETKLEARVKELKESPEALINFAKIEGDELVIPGIERNADSVVNLRQSILQFTKDALGNVSRDDLSLYKRSVTIRSFFLFKNWIPRLLDVRMQSLKYNPGSDQYEWGRVRMLGDAVRRMGLKSIASLHKQLGGNSKDIVEVAKQAYKDKKQYFADQEQDFTMNEAEFIDMYVKGVRAEFKELGLAIAMMGILVAARALAPDGDEEPETKGAYRWMLRGLDKLQDEISFFYNPISFTSVVNGSVFPAIHLLVEAERFFSSSFMKIWYNMLGDDQKADAQHPTKYLFRIFPITKELITYLAIFNDDIAKEYGVRITSQYGALR